MDSREDDCKKQLTVRICHESDGIDFYDQGIVRKVLLLLFSGFFSEFRGKSAGL